MTVSAHYNRYIRLFSIMLLTLSPLLITPPASAEDMWDGVFTYQKKMADYGNPEAQIKLGEMYEEGRGVEQDYDMARHWYSKAAEQGHQPAMLKLDQLTARIHREAEEKRRAEAERLAQEKAEAEEQARREQEEKERQAREEEERRAAVEQAAREEEDKARQQAEEEARQEEERQARERARKAMEKMRATPEAYLEE